MYSYFYIFPYFCLPVSRLVCYHAVIAQLLVLILCARVSVCLSAWLFAVSVDLRPPAQVR